MSHLPLNALRAFEAAARHLSFAKAAEELHVTPAAVSQQIRSLEDLLGVQLFHRLTRGIALTPSAEAGLPKLHEGFGNLLEGLEHIREQSDLQTLNVWMAPSFASKWLLPRLPGFIERHPEIELRINASTDLIDSADVPHTFPAESFRKNNIDLAIRFGTGDYPGCRVDRLMQVTALPMCAPALLEDRQRPLRAPEDLTHHTLLHDDTPYEGRPDWPGWLKAAGVKGVNGNRGLHFNRVSLALEAAIEGQGVVLTLEQLAETDLARKRLVIPFTIRVPMDYAYFVISQDDGAKKRNIDLFRDWLFEQVAVRGAA